MSDQYSFGSLAARQDEISDLDRYLKLPMPKVPVFPPTRRRLTPDELLGDYRLLKPQFSEGETIPQKGYGRYGEQAQPGTPSEPVYRNNEPLEDDPEVERYVQRGGGRHGVFALERTPPSPESGESAAPDVQRVGAFGSLGGPAITPAGAPPDQPINPSALPPWAVERLRRMVQPADAIVQPPENPAMGVSRAAVALPGEMVRSTVPHLLDPKTYGPRPAPTMAGTLEGKLPAVERDPRIEGAAADVGNVLQQFAPGPGSLAAAPLGIAAKLARGAKAARGAERVAEAAAPAAEDLASAGHNLPPTGSLNPLANVPVTFRGKSPAQMTLAEREAWGQHYGVKGLGEESPPQVFKDINGKDVVVPGGVEGKWTHADLLNMKANPINPSLLDRDLHAQMQRKLGRTMTPENLSDADVWNGIMFGMTSPNNPLFPNQLTASRLRLRTPEMLDDLASMIPWKPGDVVTKQQRKIVNDQIAARFGLNKAAAGGLGTRGTADYSRIGEMAQMFKENPEFFRKKPDESWLQAVERISSQVPGLSMKTGSFGTVWQDPANAGISAIDRHMARELEKRGGIFVSPKERTAWENRGVALWNKREVARVAKQEKKNAEKGIDKPVAPADLAQDFDDLRGKSGSDGFLGEMLLSHVGKELTPKLRTAAGAINPKLPQHLAEADFIREPEKVFKAGRAYKQALDVNQKIADESGLNLFMSQWMEWDRIRNRFEPHENMYPGLSNLPAQSVEQLRAVDVAHKQTGHKTYGKNPEGTLKPTRPYKGNAGQLGLYGIGGAALLPPSVGLLSDRLRTPAETEATPQQPLRP